MVNGGKADAVDSFKIYVVFNNWLMYLTQSNGPSKDHMRASCCSLTWRLYKTGICSSKNMNHLTSVLSSIIPGLWWKERRCWVWAVLFVLLPLLPFHEQSHSLSQWEGLHLKSLFSILLFLALFLLLIFHHLLLALSCLSPSASSSSLARSVSSLEWLCVSYDTCAVVVVNFCHQWLPLCIISELQ